MEEHVFFGCIPTDTFNVGGTRTVAVSLLDGHLHDLGLVGE